MLNLKKLLTKVLDRLAGTYSLYDNGVEIPANANMDNYTTEGLYFVANSATAQTLSNYPATTGGRVEIFNALRHDPTTPASSKRIIQRLYGSGSNCDIYYRYWNGSTWSAWRKVTMTTV